MIRKKFIKVLALVMAIFALSACGQTPAASGDSDSDTVQTEEQTKVSDENSAAANDADGQERITDEQALAGITAYCYAANPDLEDMVNKGEYQISWKVESSNEEKIVVLYRSYTGAEVRYYINPLSGETYVTEFVEGITPEEERTEETLNVRDYIS
ncbi:MAG: hypothetical protein K6F52_08170 [Clostridia bacterium]|nr:hypothetical protein [Clostridia bacterium]